MTAKQAWILSVYPSPDGPLLGSFGAVTYCTTHYTHKLDHLDRVWKNAKHPYEYKYAVGWMSGRKAIIEWWNGLSFHERANLTRIPNYLKNI